MHLLNKIEPRKILEHDLESMLFLLEVEPDVDRDFFEAKIHYVCAIIFAEHGVLAFKRCSKGIIAGGLGFQDQSRQIRKSSLHLAIIKGVLSGRMSLEGSRLMQVVVDDCVGAAKGGTFAKTF